MPISTVQFENLEKGLIIAFIIRYVIHQESENEFRVEEGQNKPIPNGKDCNLQKMSPSNNKILIGESGKNRVEQIFDNILTGGFYKCLKCNEMTLQFFGGDIIWN